MKWPVLIVSRLRLLAAVSSGTFYASSWRDANLRSRTTLRFVRKKGSQVISIAFLSAVQFPLLFVWKLCGIRLLIHLSSRTFLHFSHRRIIYWGLKCVAEGSTEVKLGTGRAIQWRQKLQNRPIHLHRNNDRKKNWQMKSDVDSTLSK